MSITGEGHLPLGAMGEEEIPENALRILEAAVRLFALKGYAATSVREIVQEADVTNPMLYYYFDSKEGLFRALTSMMHGAYARDMQAALEREAPFSETLVDVVDIHLRGLREAPLAVQFVYSVLFGSENSCPAHDIYQVHARMLVLLQKRFASAVATGELVIRDGLDVDWLALQLIGVVNFQMMRGVTELQNLPEETHDAWLAENASPAAAERIVDLFLHGAAKVSE